VSPPSVIQFRSLIYEYSNFERHRGVFETAHGIGENIRGRTLEAIDNMTSSGPPENNSRYSSIADHGRMEVERGMARIYGYPDPNAANVLRNEPGRPPQPNTVTPGSGHTTGTGPGAGYMHTGEKDYESYGRSSDGDSGVGRGTGGYGADDGYDQPGAQNFGRQQPAIDGDREMGPDPSGSSGLSPNRGPQNAGSEVRRSSMSVRAVVLTPTQQMMKRDPPPELPPRPQARAADTDHTTQMYQ